MPIMSDSRIDTYHFSGFWMRVEDVPIDFRHTWDRGR